MEVKLAEALLRRKELNGKVDALKNIPIRMISYGGSENNVSILVDSKLKTCRMLSQSVDGI